MVRLMRGGPASAAQLSEELGIKEESARNALVTLRHLGLITVASIGKRRPTSNRGTFPLLWKVHNDPSH